LLERNLAGPERLSVSVLVIREQLDEAGLIREGVLERRRGGVDGPYFGNVARIEFTGAARLVRRFRVSRDGRLTELPPDDDTGVAPAPTEPDTESFAGEDEAVRAYLGPDAVILDRRPPNLFEDLLGLSGIVHARRADGVEVGCGVGWHGGTPFVLAADFPRHGRPLIPPPDLEAAVENAVRTRDLIRYETRLDDQGFYVIARERGRQSLVAIRLEGRATRIDPYVPGPTDAANEDQRRWMTYAETYEARTILDSWRNGDSDEIAVLTMDPDQEAWLHIIDADGIEIARQADNEAAAAVLYRERLNPPEDTQISPDLPAAGVMPDGFPAIEAREPEYEAEADSLLTKVLAWSRVTTLLNAAITGGGPGIRGAPPGSPGAMHQLSALIEPLTALHAPFSVGSLRRLIAQTEAGTMSAASFATVLDDLITRLRDELALTRVVVLSSALLPPDDEPPFGPLVELHFPEVTYDVEEAVQCLALRRSTAAVLHAMKVMRHGLQVIERLLSTPRLTDLSWAQLIGAVLSVAGDQHELVETLVRVRRAWRAPGLLPADKYTEEEAEAVLVAVAAFMKSLAARADALGKTLAD